MLKNQKGVALIVALLILIMLTAILIAAVTTSVKDMDISKNQKEKTKAFFVAEGGLETAFNVLRNNADIFDNDSLRNLVNSSTQLPNGSFNVDITGNVPFKTVTSYGTALDGKGTVQILMKRIRNPINIWNNVIFAGVGQAGRALGGNIGMHGNVTILGDGEPFTDANGNGTWDPADTYTDTNGDGIWEPGEPLTTDADGDGLWDPAEPFTDDNANGSYDATLTATDLATSMTGTARMYNNYDGMNAVLSSRLPALDYTIFNGEDVQSLDAELRVKHGAVNLSGDASVGTPDQSGGTPAIKETFDGVYVNDGFGGDAGDDQVYSDNGTNESWDLGGLVSFPNLNRSYTDSSTGITYPSYTSYLAANAYVIAGDLTLKPGEAYTGGSNSNGAISLDANGNLSISGIVLVTGNIYINDGKGKYSNAPIIYDGIGTLVAGGNMSINTHVLSKDQFPTDDVMGFISANNLYIGTGPGASHLDLTGAFFAQNKIVNVKQNQIGGAMVSNYFEMSNVPELFQVPSLIDHLPPGMPGAGTIYLYTYKKLPGTWKEL